VPSRDAFQPAGTDTIPVQDAKVTEPSSSGACYAPRDWAGATVLVVAAPDWWEVRENPEGTEIHWEGGEKATEEIGDSVDGQPQVYIGRGYEGQTVLLARLPP
jgi:hypothetical protein